MQGTEFYTFCLHTIKKINQLAVPFMKNNPFFLMAIVFNRRYYYLCNSTDNKEQKTVAGKKNLVAKCICPCFQTTSFIMVEKGKQKITVALAENNAQGTLPLKTSLECD